MSRCIEIYERLEAGESKVDLAIEYGIKEASVSRMYYYGRDKVANKEYEESVLDSNMFVKGRSTLYDAEGNKKIEWIKTDTKKEDLHNAIKDAINDIVNDSTGKYTPKKWAPKDKYEFKSEYDMRVLFPLVDMHWGMLAHHEETDNDYDLTIAREKFFNSATYLLDNTPQTDSCIIADLGDFLHSSDDRNRTNSGNALDTDSRHHKAVKVAFESTVQFIDMCLDKFNYVYFYSVPGNHSELVSIYLKAFISAYFKNEPRVIVDKSPKMQQYHVFGKNILGFSHGHTLKGNRATESFIYDNMEHVSDSTFRYLHLGHYHSNKVTENPLCKIEIHKNLTPNDSWAQGEGYRGIGESKAIVYHKDNGEISRTIYNWNM